MVNISLAKELVCFDMVQLERYCWIHPEQYTDDMLWKEVFRLKFAYLFKVAEDVPFPDLEESFRQKRAFFPWRTLYYEVMHICSDPLLADALSQLLSGEPPLCVSEETRQELATHYELIHCVVFEVNSSWLAVLISYEVPICKAILLQDGNAAHVRKYAGELLEAATSSGSMVILRIMLDISSFIGIMTTEKVNLLALAAKKGYVDIVRLLLGQPLIDSYYQFYIADALCEASRYGHIDIVRLLVECNKFIVLNTDALRFACENGHVEVVQLLLEYMEPDADMASAAFGNGHMEIVDLLGRDGRIAIWPDFRE